MHTLKREIAMTVLPRETFLEMHRGCSIAEIIYNDIMCLLEEIVCRKIKIKEVVHILAVYCTVLYKENKITIREAYYRNKNIFSSYSVLSKTLERITGRLNIDTLKLGITPSLKGLVFGECTVTQGGSKIHLTGVSLIPEIERNANIGSAAETVLVVEKEAVFRQIVQEIDKIEKEIGHKIIVVTGKGYPCTNTLRFLMNINGKRVLGLFDCDPHGLNIYSVYKRGSRRRPYLKIPQIHRIGVFIDDVCAEKRQEIKKDTKEYALLIGLSSFCREERVQEIEQMLLLQKKASIESILDDIPLFLYIIYRIREVCSYTA